MNEENNWDSVAEFWQEYRQGCLKVVERFLEDKEGRVLDLGCGSGRNFVKNKGVVYGVDFSQNMLDYARLKAEKEKIEVKLFKEEAEKLPFPNNFFDSCIFISVLHGIESEVKRKKSLLELYRVLKPGSECLLSVWRESKKLNGKEGYIPWKSNNKVFKRYVYFFDEKELKNLLEKLGFEIVDIDNRSKFSKKNIIIKIKKPGEGK